MYLLLGTSDDPCCAAVAAALRDLGHEARIVGNPFLRPGRLAWRLANAESHSELRIRRGRRVREEEIAGVLVRPTRPVDPTGWVPDEAAYVEAEARAALLGWLWSLSCPVVNRLSPKAWYLPRLHQAFWRPLLQRCRLPVLAMRISNVEADARAFGERHGGAVYAPFTGLRRYAIAGDAPWPDLTQLQQYVPVCVTEPYGPSWTACVAGGDVVWADPEPPPGVRALQPGLRRFAAAASLDFVALAIAAARDGLATVAVERDPLLEQFNEPSRQAIVSGLVRLLTGKLRPERARRLGPPRLDAGRESGLGPARPQRGGDRL